MRAWLLYVRLWLPWWLFRLTGPSDLLRVDWCYVRWGRGASWTGMPSGRYVADLEHICAPVCECALGADRRVVAG